MLNNILWIGVLSMLIVWIINIVVNKVLGTNSYWISYDSETVYESGLSSYLVLGTKSYIISYYLIVMIFIIFEIEITLLYRILYSNNIRYIFYLFVLFVIIGIIIDIIYELI